MGRKKLNRKCKIKGCNRKHRRFGYCEFHYYRINREKILKYHKENYVSIPSLGAKKKKVYTVFTNGVTEEIKPLISNIKNKILEDCIQNPKKYC